MLSELCGAAAVLWRSPGPPRPLRPPRPRPRCSGEGGVPGLAWEPRGMQNKIRICFLFCFKLRSRSYKLDKRSPLHRRSERWAYRGRGAERVPGARGSAAARPAPAHRTRSAAASRGGPGHGAAHPRPACPLPCGNPGTALRRGERPPPRRAAVRCSQRRRPRPPPPPSPHRLIA